MEVHSNLLLYVWLIVARGYWESCFIYISEDLFSSLESNKQYEIFLELRGFIYKNDVFHDMIFLPFAPTWTEDIILPWFSLRPSYSSTIWATYFQKAQNLLVGAPLIWFVLCLQMSRCITVMRMMFLSLVIIILWRAHTVRVSNTSVTSITSQSWKHPISALCWLLRLKRDTALRGWSFLILFALKYFPNQSYQLYSTVSLSTSQRLFSG